MEQLDSEQAISPQSTGDVHDSIRPIQWATDRLCLLDQRRMPFEEHYQYLDDVVDVAGAIRDMVVRGAPAIGITAAYGVVLAARRRYAESPEGWRALLAGDIRVLAAAGLDRVLLSVSRGDLKHGAARFMLPPERRLRQPSFRRDVP